MDRWRLLNLLNRKQQAYKKLFLGVDNKPNKEAEIVLADLRNFCRVGSVNMQYDDQGRMDPIAIACANARQEVYNRISRFLYLEEPLERQLEAIGTEEHYNA